MMTFMIKYYVKKKSEFYVQIRLVFRAIYTSELSCVKNLERCLAGYNSYHFHFVNCCQSFIAVYPLKFFHQTHESLWLVTAMFIKPCSAPFENCHTCNG